MAALMNSIEAVDRKGRKKYGGKDKMQVVWVKKGNKMIEKPKYKRMRGEDLELAIKMRDEGMSYAAIGRVLGYAESTIRVHLSKKTLKVR